MIAISVCDDPNRASKLVQSLQRNGWKYEIIKASWRGFGTKLVSLKEFLEKNEVDRFVFVDGYDVLCLGTPDEVVEDLVGVEINCWPDADRWQQFPQPATHYKYPNSGCYSMTKELYLKMFHENPPLNSDDDQRWMTDMVLKHGLKLDYNRVLVQNTCGISANCGTMIDGRFVTDIGTKPVFIHANGKGDLTRYEP